METGVTKRSCHYKSLYSVFLCFDLLGFYYTLKCDIIRIIRIRNTMISFVGMIHRQTVLIVSYSTLHSSRKKPFAKLK